MSGGWKGFEVHTRTNLDCREGTTARVTAVRGDSGQDAERKEEKTQKASIFLKNTYIITN